MMFLGNPKPKSSAKLQQRIQRAMDGLPPVRQKILHQNIHNTILLQFLEGLGVAKGGGALSLRMPLPKGRVSRDFDTSINYRDDEHRGLSLPGSENGANRWLTPPTFVPFPRDWWRNILG